MKKISYLLIAITLVYSAGCSMPSIYISSLTDDKYKVSKDDKVTVFKDEQDPIEIRNFCNVLKDEMQRIGFNIVDISQADYILLVRLDEKTSKISSVLPMPSNSYSSGSVGGMYYRGSTSSTTYIPYNYNYTVKKVYLDLIVANKLKEQKIVTAWEGYIGAGKDIYDKNVKDCIYTLLLYFGRNFEGHVNIVRDKNRTKE